MGPRGGYVRLYRVLLQSPIWTQLAPAVLKVAMYFLLRANYKPIEWYGGVQMVAIPAGSFVTSYGTMVTECRLSMQQIRDAFAHLKRTHFATYRRTPRWTLVTVRNWGVCSRQNVERVLCQSHDTWSGLAHRFSHYYSWQIGSFPPPCQSRSMRQSIGRLLG